MQIYDVLLDTETLLFRKQKTAFRFTRLAEEMHFVLPVWRKKCILFDPCERKNTFRFAHLVLETHLVLLPFGGINTFCFTLLTEKTPFVLPI